MDFSLQSILYKKTVRKHLISLIILNFSNRYQRVGTLDYWYQTCCF